jgi:hypothetical protein
MNSAKSLLRRHRIFFPILENGASLKPDYKKYNPIFSKEDIKILVTPW